MRSNVRELHFVIHKCTNTHLLIYWRAQPVLNLSPQPVRAHLAHNANPPPHTHCNLLTPYRWMLAQGVNAYVVFHDDNNNIFKIMTVCGG